MNAFIENWRRLVLPFMPPGAAEYGHQIAGSLGDISVTRVLREQLHMMQALGMPRYEDRVFLLYQSDDNNAVNGKSSGIWCTDPDFPTWLPLPGSPSPAPAPPPSATMEASAAVQAAHQAKLVAPKTKTEAEALLQKIGDLPAGFLAKLYLHLYEGHNLRIDSAKQTARDYLKGLS